MNAYTEQRLQEIGHDGYRLRFDEIFGRGFEIWKKVTLPIAGVIFLLFAVIIPAYALTVPWIYGMSFQEMMEMTQEQPQVFQQIAESMDVKWKTTVFIASIAVLLSPISAGFMRMCREADFTGRTRFGSAFYYYKPYYWSRILVIGLISLVLTSGASFLFGMLGSVGGILNIAWSVLIHVFVFFAVPLVIFADANPLRAIGASIKLGAKGFFPILGFTIVGGFLALLGGFVCCVGFLFSISYAYVVNYIAYRQAIGFEESNTPGEEQNLPYAETV